MPTEQQQQQQQQTTSTSSSTSPSPTQTHPPLSSLVHPHLHTILHIGQEHGLPTPQWTATVPDEKRSLSSDKTITPSSTMKTPQASLQNTSVDDVTAGVAKAQLEKKGIPANSSSSPLAAFSSSPDGSQLWTPHPSTPLSLSPTMEKSQPDWAHSVKNTTHQSPASILAQHNRRETFAAASGDAANANSSSHTTTTVLANPKSENELWIEIADALTVTADALKQESMREPLGETSLVIHLLTLFSLSMTYKHAPRHRSRAHEGAGQVNGDAAADSAASPASSSQPALTDSINGIVLAQIQCMRTLANLCIDNDENRSHLLQHDVPLFILTLVKKTLERGAHNGEGNDSHPPKDALFDQNTLTLLKTAMGALLNLQLDHAEARAWLLRLPKPRRLHHPHEEGGHRHPHFHPHRPASHHNVGAAHATQVPNNTSSAGVLAAAADSRIVANSPFELDESDTLRILLAVATDPRIYTPSLALRSILGPRVGEFEAEDYLEDEGEGEDRMEWSPPHNRWSDVDLGAQVTAWAARIMEDLLEYETEEVRASQQQDEDDGAQTEASLLPSLSRSALAADGNTWDFLLRTLLAFVPTRNKFWADPAAAGGGHGAAAAAAQAPLEDASSLLDADLTLVSLAGELLEGCSHVARGRDANARKFKRAGVAHLEDLLDFIENGSSPLGTNTSPPPWRLERFALDVEDVGSLAKEVGRAKANVVKAVVAIASEDGNMAALFGRQTAPNGDGDGAKGSNKPLSPSSSSSSPSPFLSRMKSWLQADFRKREDVVSCALLSIANLARSDDNCLSLVYEHGVVPPLVEIVKAITSSDGGDEGGDSTTSPGRGRSSMLLAHAALGLLKNLSIPVRNKALIGTSGVLSHLAPFLSRERDHAQPIQFGAVGIVKHLAYAPGGAARSAGEGVAEDIARSAVQICGGGEDAGNNSCLLLDSLLDLIARTEDTPTRLEASRVLVNLIRTLWSSNTQAVRGASLARSRLCSPRVITALCDMFKRSGKFAVLLNEALVALTLLAARGGGGEGEGNDNAGDVRGRLLVTRGLLGRPLEDSNSLQNGNGQATSSSSTSTTTTSPISEVNASAPGMLSPPSCRAPPSRSSTGDSASTSYSSTTVTTSPATAADVLYDLFTVSSVSINAASSAVASTTPTSSASTAQAIGSGSSIKTFVPVQVAENGCALLRSLTTGGGGGDAGDESGVDRHGDGECAQKELALRLLPAIRGLKVRIGVVYGGRSGVVTSLPEAERRAAAETQRKITAALEACEAASH